MSARRRSLLDRSRVTPPKGGSVSPDEAGPEAEAPATEAEGPPPVESPLVDTSTPPPPPPTTAAPPTPTEVYAEVAAEAEYAHKGTGPEADTGPMGWGSSVHAAPDPIDDFFDTGTAAKSLPPAKSDPPRPVARDTTSAWSDPIGVPGPPPLPGISDRFTPPPSERRSRADDRPSFIPTPPPAPPPDPRANRRGFTAEDDDEEFEPEITDTRVGPFGVPRGLFIGGIVTLGLALVVAVIVIAVTSTGPQPPTPAAVVVSPPTPGPTPTEVVGPGGVPIRTGLMQPGAEEPDTAAPKPELTLPPPPVPAAGPAPAPAAPAPTAAPAPRPKPAPAVAPPPAVTKTGTLRVRSNRKVLVFVNGRAMGHAPLDLPLVPGDYTLTAALPSRPDTEQTKIVGLSAGETERVDFNF